MSSRFRPVLFAVAAASMVSLIAGCTDGGTPVDARPEAARAATAPRFASSGSLDIIAQFRKKPQVTSGGWAKAWIGPSGGRVDFLGFTIIVPRGAVDRTTMFTIRVPLDAAGSDRVVAEFEPHNVRFARPITIGFPFRGTSIDGDAANARVVWWDAGWVNMGGAVSPDGTQIFTQVPHFSEYGTTSARGGGMSLSGG